MIDVSTVSLVCGVIMCMIGVAGFATSVISKAKGEGRMLAKIDYALEGIEEIKQDMKNNKENLTTQSLKISMQEEKIKSIFRKLEEY